LKEVSVFAEVTRKGRRFAFAEATANGVSNPEVSGTTGLYAIQTAMKPERLGLREMQGISVVAKVS